MKVSKGSVVLVGSLVGIPAGDWGLAYGLVTGICENGCCASVKVDEEQISMKIEPGTLDAVMSWEGKSIAEMTEHERATFHSVWSNTWIPVQYFHEESGKWTNPRHRNRERSFLSLRHDVKRRIKPSEGVEQIEKLAVRRQEIAEQIRALNEEDTELVAQLLLS